MTAATPEPAPAGGARPDLDPERAPRHDLHEAGFTPPERVPWSELGPDFTTVWGRADPADPQPEHLEIIGPSGSGKTYLLCTCVQDRMIARQSACVLVVTKRADKVIHKLGWPIVGDWTGVAKHPNVIFWPQTRVTGTARKVFHERKIREVLDNLWQPEANTIVAFDEVGYVESLSGELRDTVQMYWREGRSEGITVAAMKQRPQGALRDMHSETYWTASFAPKDRADLERFAELFGARRDWMPVFDTLDQERREFIIRHSRSREAYISWVDVPLRPVRPPSEGRGIWGVLGRGRAA